MGLDGSTNGPRLLEVLVAYLHKAGVGPASTIYPDTGREDIMGTLMSKNTAVWLI